MSQAAMNQVETTPAAIVCRRCGQELDAQEDADVRRELTGLFGEGRASDFSLCRNCCAASFERLRQDVFGGIRVLPSESEAAS